ncbi:hypothetical protein CRV02_12775 [Arcobacter sp. CECT 8989]|uniref:hypothetical protein n=1 Tax=Arcobacter sp. CECT 8989 TaxID=2044509 RepID=UPI00100B4F5F|nr:hypothetical protein [Arcobacter sp. CECT 8989]RXJ98919.1 hypothetical protein CRV02_12775 [Arcobacter sp. CECT 8989]
MNINFNFVSKYVFTLMFLFLVSYILNIILFLILPKVGVDYIIENRYRFAFRDYDYLSTFGFKNTQIKTKQVVTKQKIYPFLSKLELNAIYSKRNGLGWIVLKEKSTKKSHILALNDSFKGYQLKKIDKLLVIFVKDKIEYKLEINKDKLKYKVMKR